MKHFTVSASQCLGRAHQVISLDRFRMHHVGGSQLILCSAHPGPADWVTKLSSCNPLVLLIGWRVKLLVRLSKTYMCEKSKLMTEVDQTYRKVTREAILTVTSGSMDLLTQLRRTKIVLITVMFILMNKTSVWTWSPEWQDEIENLTYTTSQGASNVLKSFTCLVWSNCSLTELQLRSPSTPGVD